MSATKRYEDVPGFTRDPETGKYIPGHLNVEEFLNLGSTRKSPRNVSKTGQNITQKDSKVPEKGSAKRKDLPGFVRDPETGKYETVPLDMKALASMFNNSPVNCENSQPNKFRKNDQGVRKELFTKPLPARPSLRPSSFTKGPPAKKPMKRSIIPSIIVSKSNDNQLAVPLPPTPLLNLRPLKKEFIQQPKASNDKTQEIILEKMESLFKMCQEKFEQFQQVQQQQTEDIKQILTIIVATQKTTDNAKEHTPLRQKLSSYHPKLYSTKYSASKKPSTKITSIQEEESPTVEFKTPDSLQSTDEFVKMEQLCLTPKNASVTPISSVCNLFKTMDVEEGKNLQKRRSSLLKAMDVDDSPKRRSLRLKEKIIDNQVSPVVMKSDDLRKSTLTRSLVKKYQVSSPKSPRTQKAFDMYVSTKKDYDYLLTPSFSKNRQLTDSGNSARKRISQKVQQQCLLLQDTP